MSEHPTVRTGRILSGMRPTGRLHLGNYVGALENWVRLQDAGWTNFHMVADWHMLTTGYENTSQLQQNIWDMVLDWLAAGLDPARSVIFVQSAVKEHAELHLLLSMIVSKARLERIPTLKEQIRDLGMDEQTISYGHLGYSVLQAADILLYRPTHVPVGEDQVPHPHFRDADGHEELYCVLGVRQADKQGLPEFTRNMLGTVIHEFCHSYANPLMERHLAELRASGDALFKPVAEEMRSRAYVNGYTLLCESLVRVCVIRYLRQYDGEEAARRDIQNQKRNGFVWMQEMSDLLGEYEAHRDQYPTLEDFSPRLVTFFTETAKNLAKAQTGKAQTDLAGKRPKVVSMIPANGAQDVDPGLTAIQVVFDRPMADHMALLGGGPHYPKFGKGAHFDAQHKIWTVPVTLKPDWSYEFMLNSEKYDAFRSEDGVPLEPVFVSFRTAGQKGTGEAK